MVPDQDRGASRTGARDDRREGDAERAKGDTPHGAQPDRPQDGGGDNLHGDASHEAIPVETDPLFRFDEILRSFREDSALLPVLIVVVGIIATIGTAAISLALARNFPAMGAVAGLVLMTLLATEDERKARKFGLRAKLFAVLWALSIAGALTVRRYGL